MSAVAHIQEYKTGLFNTDEFRGDMSWNGYEHNVLLRNDGTLPLDPASISTVAMIGPNAYDARIMGGGSAKVAAYRAISPLTALEARIGATTDIRYARGCDINRSTPPLGRPLLDGLATVEVDRLSTVRLSTSPSGMNSFS